MKARRLLSAALAVASAVASISAWADDGHRILQGATFSTLIVTPFVVEGMTTDNKGNLYVPGRQADPTAPGSPCPVWRVNIAQPTLVQVGDIPA